MSGGPPAKRRGRPVLLAAGLSVLAVLAAGTAWAVTQGGDEQGRKAGTEAAGAPQGEDAGGSGPTGRRGEGELGTRTKDPAELTTVSPRVGKSSPQQPRSGRPAQPRPSQQPSGGGGGGGDAPSRPNPYTPQQVCNSGGHGSGYYVQRSSAFTGGRVYQLYNSSGYNCVVTMKSSEVGQKTSVWAQLTRKDGTKGSDSGSFAYYAGPVFVYAKGQCVKYAGGGGHGSTSAPWGNCG